jgi:hypothetical protein
VSGSQKLPNHLSDFPQPLWVCDFIKNDAVNRALLKFHDILRERSCLVTEYVLNLAM